MSVAISYDRELEWNEPPSACERQYTRWTVVRAAGAPAAAWWPLARIGNVDLHLAPPGTEAAAAVLSATPLVAAKRGRRGSGDYVGVDGHVGVGGRHLEDNDNARAGNDPARPHVPMFAPVDTRGGTDPGGDRRRVVRQRRGAGAARTSKVLRSWASRAIATSTSMVAPGHGTMMAGVVLRGGARCAHRPVPDRQRRGAARSYLAPADLAAAVAVAVEDWRADVVLIAMSDGAWGTPSYLGDVLREAARCGRGGRGAAIFCSVGDPSRNHVRQDDSAVLGADDLASQPWVQAIAACDDSRALVSHLRGVRRRAPAQPTIAWVLASRWRHRANRAAGAHTSPPTTPARRPRWRRPPPRACWPPTAICRPWSCARCWH